MGYEEVILVNELDTPVGTLEKMEAHRKGILHRAFSIFIFNNKGELLLQKRAASKYHSANLWTNTCCGHPRPGEKTEDAAVRRLNEEMGFITTLTNVFSFTYQAKLENNLSEHEFDHVFIGHYNLVPKFNPDEISEWRFVQLDNIVIELKNNPDAYTAWFKLIFKKIHDYVQQGTN